MDDYSTEPRLNFKPLGNKRYSEFYSLEMDSEEQDISFYANQCQGAGSILELGCGSGRISHYLASRDNNVTGLDISPPMLELARKKEGDAVFVEGDMTNFSFDRGFSHILIPYNTLNLLQDPAAVSDCLHCINAHLEKSGTLLVQLFVPSENLQKKDRERCFQFKLIQLPGGGKLIKETIRSYHADKKKTLLEERYRVRPAGKQDQWEDLSHTLSLNTPDISWWKDRFNQAGLKGIQLFSAPNGLEYNRQSDNGVFVIASK